MRNFWLLQLFKTTETDCKQKKGTFRYYTYKCCTFTDLTTYDLLHFHTAGCNFTLSNLFANINIQTSSKLSSLDNQSYLHISTDPAVVGSERRVVKTPVVQVIVSGVEVPRGVQSMLIMKQGKSYYRKASLFICLWCRDCYSHNHTVPSRHLFSGGWISQTDHSWSGRL